MRTTTFSIAACLCAAGCDSPVANLFGNPVFGAGPSAVEVARDRSGDPLADQIVSLEAAPTPAGVLVTAVALPASQGFWDPRLVPVPSDDPSVYLLEFRLLPPLAAAGPGTPSSREVLAGRMLTRRDLGGVRVIAVRGARNVQSVRRQ